MIVFPMFTCDASILLDKCLHFGDTLGRKYHVFFILVSFIICIFVCYMSLQIVSLFIFLESFWLYVKSGTRFYLILIMLKCTYNIWSVAAVASSLSSPSIAESGTPVSHSPPPFPLREGATPRRPEIRPALSVRQPKGSPGAVQVKYGSGAARRESGRLPLIHQGQVHPAESQRHRSNIEREHLHRGWVGPLSCAPSGSGADSPEASEGFSTSSAASLGGGDPMGPRPHHHSPDLGRRPTVHGKRQMWPTIDRNPGNNP